MHFSLLELVPLTVGAIGGVLCRRAFLYVMQVNSDRQAKAEVESRAQRIEERREARNQYVKTDEIFFSDSRDEVIRG